MIQCPNEILLDRKKKIICLKNIFLNNKNSANWYNVFNEILFESKFLALFDGVEIEIMKYLEAKLYVINGKIMPVATTNFIFELRDTFVLYSITQDINLIAAYLHDFWYSNLYDKQ